MFCICESQIHGNTCRDLKIQSRRRVAHIGVEDKDFLSLAGCRDSPKTSRWVFECPATQLSHMGKPCHRRSSSNSSSAGVPDPKGPSTVCPHGALQKLEKVP